MTSRIERAMTLLRKGDLSATDVCYEVSSASFGTIATRFTELVGVSPDAYERGSAGIAAGIHACHTK